ncbi:MAG: Zn-ribbon domain-containing OB-fold protein [Alphaproteobacteria bacterium]|nr:Zn-ribbon domain-containing OB-fold protein [Alphaproteobacteria bacterium]
MELQRPLPTPMTPEAKPYWDGLKDEKLMLPKCGDCKKAFFYPRIACPHCHSRNIGWEQASGKGVLYSFEIAYRSLNPAFKIEPPYVLAMIELEEGPRIMSNLINIEADPAVVKIGAPVEVVFEKQNDDVTIALFQPAS